MATEQQQPLESPQVSVMDEEDPLMRYVLEQVPTHDITQCNEDECFVCSYLICPSKCIEHLLHDGCPECSVPKETVVPGRRRVSK